MTPVAIVIHVYRGGCEAVYSDRVWGLQLVGRHASREVALAVGDEITFDAEKGTHYEMDTALHFKHLANGERVAHVVKHRSFRKPMPSLFEIETMDVTVDHFGDAISRKAVPIQYITEETKTEISGLLDLIGVEIEMRRKALKKYGVTRLEDLKQKQAEEILAKLQEIHASRASNPVPVAPDLTQLFAVADSITVDTLDDVAWREIIEGVVDRIVIEGASGDGKKAQASIRVEWKAEFEPLLRMTSEGSHQSPTS